MQRKKPFFADLIFILFCTAASALCIFLFWRDLNATLYRMDEQPAGIITFRYNAAQRRFVDRVLWDRLRNDSPVFNGDIIRTAALSEASITFTSGDTVDLSENTLIQIFSDYRGSRLDLAGGGVSVTNDSDTSMIIHSGESRLVIEPGAVVQAASLEDGALNITVSEGAVVLERASQAHAIEAGSGLFLSADGEVLAVPQAVALFPVPGARFLSQEAGNFPVDFNWNKLHYQDGGLTRLEVAYDRAFNRVRVSQETYASELSLALPEGTWFWRLQPVHADERLSAFLYSRLTIVYSPVPSLITPLEGQVFSFRSRPPALRFQWSASPGASFYMLEAADNPLMQNPALSIRVSSLQEDRASFVSSALEEGTWYWRVTPVYTRGFAESGSSVTRPFVIERGAPLSAPVLTAPLENAQLNIETGRRDIIFSWRRENEAASYTFRVSANRDMSSPIIEQTLTAAFFRYDKTLLSPGTWYWTVLQTDAEGIASAPSQPRTFTALQGEALLRPVFPPDNFVIAEHLLPDMRFTWRTNLSGARFQISQDADFSLPVIDEAAPMEVQALRSLQSGVYYWRITGDTAAGVMESPVRRFTVADPLPPPELAPAESPLAASETGCVVISAGQSTVNFSWEPMPEASYYIFRMYRGETAEAPILETIVSGSSFSVDAGGLEDGTYIWSVQGLAREGLAGTRRTGFSAMQPISIRHLRTVSLEHPRDGWTYDGITASRSPGMVRWYSPKIPFNVVFTLARDALMTDIVTRQANISTEHVLPRLNAGDYFWTVHAQDAEGFDISPPVPAHFRVLPITPLPIPQNRLPAAEHVITPAQILASRSVVFSWNSVPGANGYRLTVFRYDGETRVPVIQTPVLSQTVYTVEDIRFLGRGNFSWQVESLYVDRGFIEQHGLLQENTFYVDVPSPQHIRTLDTGILYGR